MFPLLLECRFPIRQFISWLSLFRGEASGSTIIKQNLYTHKCNIGWNRGTTVSQVWITYIHSYCFPRPVDWYWCFPVRKIKTDWKVYSVMICCPPNCHQTFAHTMFLHRCFHITIREILKCTIGSLEKEGLIQIKWIAKGNIKIILGITKVTFLLFTDSWSCWKAWL